MFRRTLLTGLLALSLLALTILGAPQAAHAGTHGARCLATTLNGSPAPCPERELLSFINFHLNAFKNFSQAQVDVAAALAAVFAILFLVAVTALTLADVSLPLGLLNFFPLSFLKPNFHRWLSFHENSPNAF